MADEFPEDQRLIGISPKAYEHPADRAATAALGTIPMLDTVVRKLIEFGYERAVQQMLLASAVRLGEDQLPEVWASHRAALARLDIDEVPDLYMAQMPFINAMAIGSKKPMVVLNSGTVNTLDELELRTVLGHEAGHILSDHVMYTTALYILLSIGTGPLMRLPFFAGVPLLAITLALREWSRAAELSCDRAATLVTRSPMTTCQTLMVIAGGAASRKLSLDAFIRQANEYEDWEPGWDKLSRFRTELMLTHPFPVRRVSELHEVGPLRRLRPDHERRVPQARPEGGRAAGGRRRGRVLRGALQDDLPRGRRGRVEGRRQGGRRRREARGVAEALAGRTAVVTGGTRGLGLEIARAFVAAGARVLVTGRDQAALDASGLDGIRADVSDPAACAALADRGPFDVLVNNAGVSGPIGPVEAVDWEDWVETIRINLFGTVLMSRAVIPGDARARPREDHQPLGRRRDRRRARTSAPTRPPRWRWCGSRRRSREELRGTGIDVNAIAPGASNTRMRDDVRRGRS